MGSMKEKRKSQVQPPYAAETRDVRFAGTFEALVECFHPDERSSVLETARQAITIAGPIVRFGTKWPSITSRCRTSAPCSMLAISSASFEKSAERRDGASLMVTG